MQADIANYLAFLSNDSGHGHGNGDHHGHHHGHGHGRGNGHERHDDHGNGHHGDGVFQFQAFDLRAVNFENLEVTVDGVALNPADEPVDARDDAFASDEDTAISGDVLADNGNGADDVPDLVANVELVNDASAGVLVLNSDGSFTYDPQGAYDYLSGDETATETFTYRVYDADGDYDEATATIMIHAVGSAATDQTYVPDGNLFAGATQDGDPEGSWVSSIAYGASQMQVGPGGEAQIAGQFGALTINADGSYSYDLDNGSAAYQALASGELSADIFTYTFEDPAGHITTAELTVKIAGHNPAHDDIVTNISGSLRGFGLGLSSDQAEFFIAYLTGSPTHLDPAIGGIPDTILGFGYTIDLESGNFPRPEELNLLANDPAGATVSAQQVFVDDELSANSLMLQYSYDGYDPTLSAIYSAEVSYVAGNVTYDSAGDWTV